MQLVLQHGTDNWSFIASKLQGRIGKQCRERWYNHLDPNIKKDPLTPEEENILLEAHNTLGNKWSEIANLLPGRTDNQLKNHFHSYMYHKEKGTLGTREKKKTKLQRHRSEIPVQFQSSIFLSEFDQGTNSTSDLSSFTTFDSPQLEDFQNDFDFVSDVDLELDAIQKKKKLDRPLSLDFSHFQ